MIGTALFACLDAADITPSDADPNTIWFDASRAETLTFDAEGRVMAWRDGGGLGHVFTQPEARYRPGWTGEALVFENAAHMVMASPVTADTTALTLRIRLRTTQPGSWDNPLSFGTEGLKLSIGDDMTWRWYSASPVTSAPFGPADQDTEIELHLSPVQSWLRTNGVMVQSYSNTAVEITAKIRENVYLGVRSKTEAGSPIEAWNGLISLLEMGKHLDD